MNKLTEQNLLKKLRFLKYSLLVSISVGAIIAIPFEGMASSNQKALFRDALEKKLSLRLSQSNGNRDTTNTPQQIGTVIVPEPERNTCTPSEIREMEISKQSKAFNPSNPLKDIPIEDHYKEVARSKSDVGKARKVRTPTGSKIFVGTEKVEQNQNNYTPEPTEQTPQKPEIIITASSPTVSSASNGFVAAPNTPNTTLTSPEHYTTAPGTPSTPATPYQPTLDSKPNDNLGAKTPPNTNSKAVRRLSFSSEPQQTVQPSTQAKPPVPPKPLLSSAEVAKKMVDNILRVNEKLGSKLADVESTIKNTQGKENKKPLQQLQKQIVSSQKKTKALKLEAAEIGIKIKALDEENKSLASWNQKTGGVKNKRELDKDSVKLKENKKKIDKLQQKLTNKNNEANRLSKEIDISVNKVVLIKPQVKAPVTEMPSAGSFLNQQQQLEVLAQQQKVNATRQAVVDKKRVEANEVKRNSTESKELISEREGVQLERNQQHIAVEKTKKQQQAEDKQRTEREKKRKEENHQKEKARDIVRIREDIAKKMQQISNANTTSNRLQELELKVGAIEDEKQRQEAQKQLSKIKKQEKAIKATADEAQKILNDAEKEVSRTKLQKLQEQMDNHVAMVTNDKIEENIKKLEALALTPSTTSSAVTISNQSLTAKPTMQLSDNFQRTLPEDEDGYLEPIKVQQQQLEVLAQQQKVNATRQAVVDKKRVEANEVKRNSTESKELISEREGVQLERNQQHIAVEKTKKQQQAEDKQRTEREKKRKEENHQKEKARDIVRIREDIAKKMQQISNANTTSNRLQELELKVGAIEDEKQRQEAQKQLSKIKKQEKAIKATADEAQKILNDAEKEVSRTKLQKLQEQMDNHVAMVTNDKIEENIKKLEALALTPSTTSSAVTISNQSLTAKPTMQLSDNFQRTLPEDEDGYLEPIKVQQQPHTVMLSNQEVADPKSMDSGLGSLPSGILGKETDEDAGFYLGEGNVSHMQTASVNSSLESNPMLAILQQQIQENRSKTYGPLPSHPKDIYEAKVSQYINYLNSIQPNQSNQAQIDSVIDSLATEMRKLRVDQFNQKLEEIAHLVGIKAYEGLVSKVYEIQQANLLQTTTTDESSRSNKNWKNPALYSLSSELDKKGLEYLDLAGDAFAQKSKQPDTLTIETLGLITQTQNPTVAKSDSLKKSNVSGSIPEMQQPQSEKMRTETLDVQNDLGLDLHSQEEQLKSMDSGFKSLEDQNLSSAYDFEQLSASWDAAYNQRMNTKAENVPQETLTDESTYSVSSKKKQSKLEQDIKAIDPLFQVAGYSDTGSSELSRSYSVGDISDLLSDTESNLSRSPSINGLEDLSGSNVMKLERTLEEKKFYINKNRELFSELLREDNYDPFLTDLGNQIFRGEQEIQQLEEEKKILEDKVTPNSLKDKPLRRPASASSLNIFGSNEDLSWDNTGDIGVGHRYSAEDSCPTPDQSSSKIANSSDKNSSEIKLALLRTYQMAVIVKRQELEQLPSTSSGAAQIVQQIEVLRAEEELVSKVLSRAEKYPLAFDQAFSFEEINKELKKYDAEIPISLDPQYNSDEDIAILVSSLDEGGEKFNREMDKISASDGKSESTLPAGNEEQEDTEVTESGIQKAGDKGLLALPVSSNECALALSDGREKECLALGDGSEDEESYDSGFEEEEEIIEQLSDSDGGNLKITEVDTAIPLEQKAKKEMQTQISENAPTLNQAKVVNTIVNNIIRNRLDASMNMSNNMVAVGAGDEEESHIKRGLWMRGMYGTNNHGRIENMTGYRGTNKGATIGFDVEIDNNILGIAYSNVHSVFKFKNSKNNDKELIDSHVVSIYGQKELPRNFALQALVSASKNFIKDKTTYSYGDTKIRSNVKHRNHSYNAEALLNYNYLLQNKLVITPNIGLRYGKSRDGIYNETGINVQEIALTMKENNILSGIVGTKVKVPLKDVLKFNNLGLTFQGAVEHNFKEKTQRINRVVKIFDTEFKQNYAIPQQPKTSYNLGTGIIGSIKNTTISLDYNYYLNKHYRSHQGSVKLKVNL